MLQLQFLGGCLTKRLEVLVTLQSPAEIGLCVIFDIMIYWVSLSMSRRFIFGSSAICV